MAADLSVPVTALPMTRELSPRADALALRRWVRLLRRERPFLVMTATPKASLVGLVAARLTGVPRRVYYLGGLRLEGETGVRRSVLAPAERLTASCAHVVVVNSPSLAVAVSRLRVAPAGKIQVIQPASSHGVDTTYFVPRQPDPALRHRLGLADGVPVVGFVGRVTADKGVGALVEALRLLRADGRRVQLARPRFAGRAGLDRLGRAVAGAGRRRAGGRSLRCAPLLRADGRACPAVAA